MGVGRAEGVTCTCASHTRRAEGSTWQQERALPRTPHPPILSVFFFAFWLCQQAVTKSWQNRAEPLAAGGTQPSGSAAACAGWLWLGDNPQGRGGRGRSSLCSQPHPGAPPSRTVSWSIGFLQAQRGGCRNNFARCATAVCQHERRWFCQEVASEKELGRLRLARLDSAAVSSSPSSPGLNSPELLSAMAWGELKNPPWGSECSPTPQHLVKSSWELFFFLASAHLKNPSSTVASVGLYLGEEFGALVSTKPAGSGLAPKAAGYCTTIKTYHCNSWERCPHRLFGPAKSIT